MDQLWLKSIKNGFISGSLLTDDMRNEFLLSMCYGYLDIAQNEGPDRAMKVLNEVLKNEDDSLEVVIKQLNSLNFNKYYEEVLVNKINFIDDNKLLEYYTNKNASEIRKKLLNKFNINNMENNQKEVIDAFKFAKNIAKEYQLAEALPNIVLVINKLFANNNN